MDIWTPSKRSEVMSRIKGRGNEATEQKLAALLEQAGITGWRRHLPLLGKPDFAFPKSKVGSVRGRMLLARLPQMLQASENQSEILG